MFGWEFFVPEDSDKTDWQLLREACQLASRDDFRETRQSFHYWLKHMHEGNVDPETARDDMLKRLREYRAIIRGSRMKTVPRYVAKVAPVLAPLAHLVLPETYAIGGDAAAGGASLIVEWLLPEKKSVIMPGQPRWSTKPDGFSIGETRGLAGRARRTPSLARSATRGSANR